MNSIPTGKIPPASAALRGAEWMAENAYIAPGFHRLLTAGGLTLGLWGGRRFMDVITAREASNGEEIEPIQVPEIVRPIHGIMRYNTYSDAPTDRWKFVIDRIVPVAIGAFGAYWGGKLFFHGKLPGHEPFSTASATARKLWEGTEEVAADKSTMVTEALLRIARADAIRKPAAATFVEGSSTGMHLPGALWPFNNGMIALSFQEGAGRNIFTPFRWINRALGNFGASSRYLYGAMSDTAKWMESNIQKFKTAEEWAHPEALLRRAQDGLQLFPHRTVEDERKLVGAFRQLIDDAYQFKANHVGLSEAELGKKLHDFISGRHNPQRGLLGSAYDHFLTSHGFDLSNIKLAPGPIAGFSWLVPGAKQKQAKFVKEYAEYLKKFGYELDNGWVEKQLHLDSWKVAAAYSGGAAAIGVALTGATIASKRLHKNSEHEHHTPHEESALHSQHAKLPDVPHKADGGNLVDWINNKPLDVMHWISRVLITPPSMHRFMNAAYLSAVLYGGMKFGNVLTGRKLTKLTSGRLTAEGISESVLPREAVWAPFRPLHGLLEYTPGSAALKDRWRQAAHYTIPVGLGMFGTYTGSYLYFKDRIKSLEHPHTLEDYADRISMEQSKFYAGATALTSIFNTGSGIHMLPVFNYSSNLHNRYLMGSGQQVALPGLGKWWSGNAGTTPWGVKRSLDYLANYLTFNPAARPEELPTIIHSVIGKLYPTLPETELLDVKQTMIDRIYDVRDSYLAENVVPKSKQPALAEAMKQIFSGVGFEALMRSSGLDPAKADLANNGASGAIANFFGHKKEVRKLADEYRKVFTERLSKERPILPQEYLRTLLDKGPAANEGSFSDRVKVRPAPESLSIA